MKEQINPIGVIELTDEELQGMRGGWHHGDDCGDWESDCGDRDRGDRCDFRGDDGFRFRGFDRRCDW